MVVFMQIYDIIRSDRQQNVCVMSLSWSANPCFHKAQGKTRVCLAITACDSNPSVVPNFCLSVRHGVQSRQRIRRLPLKMRKDRSHEVCSW